MSVFSSGLITFWLRTPGRHWKKICHVTLMRWPVTAGRLHFCHVLVHQPWNRWYPRFFGAHQRQKTTPPKRGHFKITKWLEQIRPWILRFYPEDSGTKLDLNFSNSWFFFPPGKRGKTKKNDGNTLWNPGIFGVKVSRRESRWRSISWRNAFSASSNASVIAWNPQ